jgi:hypothetical protein
MRHVADVNGRFVLRFCYMVRRHAEHAYLRPLSHCRRFTVRLMRSTLPIRGGEPLHANRRALGCRVGKAKSYSERLFEFVPIGALSAEHSRQALCNPAAQEGVNFEDSAVHEILTQTVCYPYFLQEWGKHAWAVAERSPITEADAFKATTVALAELDASFFRVRFDRLTPAEKRYMRAMAELGPGPHRSGDVADVLGKKVNLVAPVRSKLIAKGMAYCPSHGDIAFTVPLFDGFMLRTMPNLD